MEGGVTLLPPLTAPVSEPGFEHAVWQVGKYIFRADFDSGNLGACSQGSNSSEFQLWTRKDSEGTANERATRSWFYFGVSGQSEGDFIVLNLLNLNKQTRLYSQDYRPWFWHQGQQDWQPISNKVSYKREGDDFQLRFSFKFDGPAEVFFAFAVPFSYRDTQALLDHMSSCVASFSSPPNATTTAAGVHTSPDSKEPTVGCRNTTGDDLDQKGYPCDAAGTNSSSSELYVHRQLIARSLEGRCVELLTITDCWGMSQQREVLRPWRRDSDSGHQDAVQQEPPAQQPYPETGRSPYCSLEPAHAFPQKQVFFVSCRVHPGETPATHMFNGMLEFLLRRDDARAAALRRVYVFKLVPCVNPDGVAQGFYRTDTLGQNLNRYYVGQPDRVLQPAVWAIKRVMLHHAARGDLGFYLDLHAHANKKGVFVYGNTLTDPAAALQALVYSKLVAMNSPVFDFEGCNYTEKNMSRADKDGMSKEGAARVALFKETGVTHLYTVEANYNVARVMNVVAPACGAHNGRASPASGRRFPVRLASCVLHGCGRALLIAALDLRGVNPWSRLPSSEHRSVDAVAAWLCAVVRGGADTRAQHLPALSDTCIEALRSLHSRPSLPLQHPLPAPSHADADSSLPQGSDARGGAAAVVGGGQPRILSRCASGPSSAQQACGGTGRSRGMLASASAVNPSSTAFGRSMQQQRRCSLTQLTGQSLSGSLKAAAGARVKSGGKCPEPLQGPSNEALHVEQGVGVGARNGLQPRSSAPARGASGGNSLSSLASNPQAAGLLHITSAGASRIPRPPSVHCSSRVPPLMRTASGPALLPTSTSSAAGGALQRSGAASRDAARPSHGGSGDGGSAGVMGGDGADGGGVKHGVLRHARSFRTGRETNSIATGRGWTLQAARNGTPATGRPQHTDGHQASTSTIRRSSRDQQVGASGAQAARDSQSAAATALLLASGPSVWQLSGGNITQQHSGAFMPSGFDTGELALQHTSASGMDGGRRTSSPVLSPQASQPGLHARLLAALPPSISATSPVLTCNLPAAFQGPCEGPATTINERCSPDPASPARASVGAASSRAFLLPALLASGPLVSELQVVGSIAPSRRRMGQR